MHSEIIIASREEVAPSNAFVRRVTLYRYKRRPKGIKADSEAEKAEKSDQTRLYCRKTEQKMVNRYYGNPAVTPNLFWTIMIMIKALALRWIPT
ncbi:hypothetical protein MASR1M31_21640 [Porphyromonadaceae bacterium]